jgi:hypothetical protein
MALIKEDYDLSGGATFSDVIASPENVNLSWKSTVATDTAQVVALEWWVQVGGEDYHQLPDRRKKDIISKLVGNESDNTNVFGINATNLKIKIVPPSGADGTLNLWAITT